MTEDRAIRIISAAPAVAEIQVNELARDYAPIVWNIQPGDNGVMVTVVMLHKRELPRPQIAMPVPGVPGAFRPQ